PLSFRSRSLNITIARRSPCSRHCAGHASQSKQSPRPSPLPAYQKPLLGNGRRSLSDSQENVLTAFCLLPSAFCLLVFRHHFFSTAEKTAHFTLLGHRKNLQSISAALF